uniref:Uncharacterized protein n=1 Tax=Oryza glumipatula TaxID=40148 RepID=A0A0D9Z7U2_9ORYZ
MFLFKKFYMREAVYNVGRAAWQWRRILPTTRRVMAHKECVLSREVNFGGAAHFVEESDIGGHLLKSSTIFGLAAAMPLSSTVAGGNMDGQGLAGLIMVMNWPREDMELEEMGALERKKRLFALRFYELVWGDLGLGLSSVDGPKQHCSSKLEKEKERKKQREGGIS